MLRRICCQGWDAAHGRDCFLARRFVTRAAGTGYIGRDYEWATARSLLLNEAVPLLTLTGAGGVGKTRLALAVAPS